MPETNIPEAALEYGGTVTMHRPRLTEEGTMVSRTYGNILIKTRKYRNEM